MVKVGVNVMLVVDVAADKVISSRATEGSEPFGSVFFHLKPNFTEALLFALEGRATLNDVQMPWPEQDAVGVCAGIPNDVHVKPLSGEK